MQALYKTGTDLDTFKIRVNLAFWEILVYTYIYIYIQIYNINMMLV